MHHTQLLVGTFAPGKDDPARCLLAPDVTSLAPESRFTIPGLMQGSAAGEACSSAKHAATSTSPDSLPESVQGGPAAQSVPGPGALPLVLRAALQYS